MKANIFIPISRNTESLNRCLASLAKQTDSRFSVIAVSLTDDDEIKKLLNKHLKNYLVLVQTKPGLLHAATLALNHAKDDIFIRIDDDVVTDPDWLRSIFKTFEDTSVGGVTGPTIVKEELQGGRDLFSFLHHFSSSSNLILKFISFIFTSVIYEGKLNEVSQFARSGAFTLGSNFEETVSQIKHSKSVDNLEACNFSVRRILLERFGGFDQTFSHGLSEYHEADVACKITEAGYQNIFNPKAKVWHNVEKSEDTRGDSYHRIQNFIIFYRRHLAQPNIMSWLRFLLYIKMQNAYYIYLFLKTGKWELLGAIPGSIVGLFRVI